jgi:tRNA threonylcarbamoyladenosine biosynthesis protein TsaB
MLLAIDTSSAQIGLALYDGALLPGEFVWRSALRHTQELAPALAELLRRTEVEMEAISALGVALGPGSFTSLRVGLAFAKGLALARHVPLIGVPTLDVVAAAVPLMDRRLAAAVQAGRGRLAVGWYQAGVDGWQAEGPAELVTAEELVEKIHKPVIVCGEFSAADRRRLMRKIRNVTLASPAQCVRRPGVLAELAWQRWKRGETDAPASLAPIYLHTAGGLPA